MREQLSPVQLQQEIVSAANLGVRNFRGAVSPLEIFFPEVSMSASTKANLGMSRLPIMFIPDPGHSINPRQPIEAIANTDTLILNLRGFSMRGEGVLYLPIRQHMEGKTGLTSVCGSCSVSNSEEVSKSSKPYFGQTEDSESLLLLASKAGNMVNNLNYRWFVSSVRLPHGWEAAVNETVLKEFAQRAVVKEYVEGPKDGSYNKRAYDVRSSKSKSSPKRTGDGRQARMATTSEKKRENGWKQR